MDFGIAGKGAIGLGQDKGRAAHAFHAACNHQFRLARLDRAGGRDDRVHARTAESVHRGTRHGNRQAREKRRHACNIAIVFPRLVCTAVNDVVNRAPIDGRIPLDQHLYRDRRQIVGPHRGKRSAEPADRSADIIADEGVRHRRLP